LLGDDVWEKSIKELVTFTDAVLTKKHARCCVLFSPRDYNDLWTNFEVLFCKEYIRTPETEN
jgi:hypothetical protein